MNDPILLSDPSKITKPKIKDKIAIFYGMAFDDLSKEDKDQLLAILLMEHGYLTEDGIIMLPESDKI